MSDAKSSTTNAPAAPAAKPAVNLTINGKAVSVPPGTSVFQAAAQVGIFIPHYCYHPDLPVAGVCRMCLCDIEKNPKLQVSCNTMAAEGMVVVTNTPKVRDAVKGVLELHLINHPLDCPICDKAGECKLQDFYRDYGLYKSEMEFEKVHKPKAKDIGTIVLDAERCILCTRCVRFTAEVTHTNELSIFNRGDRSELQTYDGEPLRNAYTGNLADICPVGALTAKDFRFQCRVWFLDKTSSVCAQCARGCNTQVSVNPQTKTLYRVEPRRNPDVNKSWICDTGRWEYHDVYQNRLTTPRRSASGGAAAEVTWAEAFSTLNAEIAANPSSVGVALSGHLTNEEIADAVAYFAAVGVNAFTWVVDEAVVGEKTPYDGVLRHHDRTSNAMGLQRVTTAMGATLLKHEAFAKKSLTRVLAVGLESANPPGWATLLKLLPSSVRIAVHSVNDLAKSEHALSTGSCDIWLPGVSSFEKSGTLFNALGRWQKLNASLPAQYLGRDAHAVVFGLGRGDDRERAPLARAAGIYDAESTKWGPRNQTSSSASTVGPLAKFPALGISEIVNVAQ